MSFTQSLAFQKVGLAVYVLSAICLTSLLIIHITIILHQLGYINASILASTEESSVQKSSRTRGNIETTPDISTNTTEMTVQTTAEPTVGSTAKSTVDGTAGLVVQTQGSPRPQTPTGGNPSLSAQHSTLMRKERVSKYRQSWLYRSIGALTIVTLIAFMVVIIDAILVKIATFNNDNGDAMDFVKHCSAMIKSGTMAAGVGKCSLYATMLLRCQFGFKESTFGYSKLTLRLVWITITVGSLVMFFSGGAYARGHISYNNDYWICNSQLPLWLAAAFALFDILVSVILLAMFIRPLKALHRTLKESNTKISGDGNSDTLKTLAKKYVILVSVAIVTSMISLITVGLMGTALPLAIDFVINCVCILLMSASYQWWYRRICCAVISFCDTVVYPTTKHINNAGEKLRSRVGSVASVASVE